MGSGALTRIGMKLIDGVPVWGDPVDEGALAQIKTTRLDNRCRAVALMADHHLGYGVPIGGVVAYENAVSPSGSENAEEQPDEPGEHDEMLPGDDEE